MENFESVENAKNYICSLAGVDLKTAEFVEDSKLKVEDMNCMPLDDSDTSEEIKKEICDRMIAAQEGFHFKSKEGRKVSIVIGPCCRGGFNLWLMTSTGSAHRV